MTRTIIYHSDRFDLVSYGMPGEDAAQFRKEIEAWERIDPEKPYDEIYAEIMSEYEAVASNPL